jgi:branched-chain amino acid transport system permease protein
MLAQLALSGISQGAIYALVALSMTLVYRTTTIVNFAHGDFVMAGACVVYVATAILGVSYIPAAVIALAVLFAAGISFQIGLIRPIAMGPHLSMAMMTIALSYLLRGIARFIWGREIIPVPSPFTMDPVDVAGVIITAGDIAILVTVVVALGIFYFVFYHTNLGKKVQAAYQSERGAALVGINVGRLKTFVWGAGAAMGALGGILIAPVTMLYPDMGAGILIRAFAAMTLGGFGSLPGAVVGGLILGLGEVLAGAYVSTALIDITGYLVIIVVLLVRPHGLFGRAASTRV